MTTNIVYLGLSLDGYIAGPDGDLGWLEYVPVPEGDDLGYGAFMQRIDAVVMGRITFETVLGFGMGWHYGKPGIILSSTLTEVPSEVADQVQLAHGTPADIVAVAEAQGYQSLYIDGGVTVQQFLQADLVDEMILATIPILVGGGIPLFGTLAGPLGFELLGSEVLADQIVKNHYRRKRT